MQITAGVKEVQYNAEQWVLQFESFLEERQKREVTYLIKGFLEVNKKMTNGAF